MNSEPQPDVQIYISLGGDVDLGITNDDHLVLADYTAYRVDLGKATVKRIEQLQEYFERLKIHAVEEKVL